MERNSFFHRFTPSDTRPQWLAAALALAAYAITLGGTFIYDDRGMIDDDRTRLPGKWIHFAWENYNGGIDNLYRPLTSWTFALQFHTSGESAWPMHAVNWILHALVCVLVARLAGRLANRRAAYIAGVLFALHPIHVEAVAYLVGRADLLCTAGVLGAALLLLEPMTVGRAMAIGGLMILATLSKEPGMLVPIMAMLIGVSFRQPNSSIEGRGIDRVASWLTPSPQSQSPVHRRGAVALLLILCWLGASYVLFREQVLKFEWNRNLLEWAEQPMIRCSSIDRWLMPVVLIGRYAWLMIAPMHLSPSYDARVIGYIVDRTDPYLYLGCAVAVAYILAIAWCWRRRESALLFCLLAAGLFYGVVGNIVLLTGTIFGERLMYLPSAFLLIAAAIVLSRLPVRVTILAVTLIAGLYAWRTVSYAWRWNNRLTFYEYCVAEQPRSAKMQMLLTDEYVRAGRLDDAAAMIAHARQVTPDYVEVWIWSAHVANEQREFDNALEYIKHAERIRPSMRTQHWRQTIDESRAKQSRQ